MWCIYAVEYYSVLKKNAIWFFVEMWVGLENVIQSEVRKRKVS